MPIQQDASVSPRVSAPHSPAHLTFLDVPDSWGHSLATEGTLDKRLTKRENNRDCIPGLLQRVSQVFIVLSPTLAVQYLTCSLEILLAKHGTHGSAVKL